MTNPDLDRDRIVALLTEVGALLHGQGLQGSIYVAGGAAMSLVFDSRTATRDVDAVFRSDRGQLLAAAQVVARTHGLPLGWLNDRVAALVPPGDDPEATEVLVVPGLWVVAASAEHLLAMKMYAGRDRDLDDLVVLFGHLGITSAEQAVAVTEAVLGDAFAADRPPREYLEALAQDVLARLAT